MSNYIILIPNSESKHFGGDESLTYRLASNLQKYNFFKTLQPNRDLIIDEIKRLIRDSTLDELEYFFDLKDQNLKSAISNMTAFKDEECMNAILRMKGTMYKSIDYEGLSSKKRQLFNQNIIILDALFGLLKPLDMIPNYKCKVSMRLFDKTLAKFWNQELKGFLKYTLKDKIVIDILPQSHREMITPSEDFRYLKISFVKKDKDSFKQEGHTSKILKGELISHFLNFENITIEDIKKFEHTSGHKYSEKFSDENNIIFIK